MHVLFSLVPRSWGFRMWLTFSLFVYAFRLFCFDGQCNYLLLDGGAKVGPVGGFLAELTFTKMHQLLDQRFVFLEWGVFREVIMVWEFWAICTKTNSCTKAWLLLLLHWRTGCSIARPYLRTWSHHPSFARQLDRDSKILLVYFSNLQKAFSISLKILLDSRFLLVRKPTSSCCELPSNFPEEKAKNTGIKCDPGYGLRDLLVLR